MWLSLEAGLLEEFYFRWFLRSRLSAWGGSEISGIFIDAFVSTATFIEMWWN